MDGFQNGKNTPDTPGVFVRVASKGLAGYGAWQSARKMGGGVKCAAMWKSFPTAPTPGFLYHPSVAVAELRRRVRVAHASAAPLSMPRVSGDANNSASLS